MGRDPDWGELRVLIRGLVRVKVAKALGLTVGGSVTGCLCDVGVKE